jgi:hypothetical protein
MAGFRKESPYFVARANLNLPKSVEWYCKKLLPALATWRQQAGSRRGDKSTLCDKFLNYLLPYFVEVLVQDGVYFVKDFPDHPMTQYLKVSTAYVCRVLSSYFTIVSNLQYYYTQNKIPHYERFALVSRRLLAQEESTRVPKEVSALNAGAQAALEHSR